MVQLIEAVAGIVAVFIIGYALELFIVRNRLGRGIGLSLALGFGFLAESSLVFLALSERISFAPAYLAFAAGLIGIVYVKLRVRPPGPSRLSSFRERLRELSEKPASEKTVTLFAIAVIAVVVVLVGFNLVARPMYQFDSRAIWGMKAKILYHERTIFSEAVEDISRNHPHPRYPLLVPVAMAWVFESMGEPDDRLVRLVFLAFFIGFVAAVYRLLRVRAGPATALLCLSVLLISPFIYSSTRAGASSGYADLALSFYMVMGALLAMLWLKERNTAHFVLAALMAACAGLTKNEGSVFAANLFLSASVFSVLEKGGGRSRLRDLALFAVIVVAMLTPWLYVRSNLPEFLDENYLRYVRYEYVVSGLQRLPEIMKMLGLELVNTRNWGILWVLIAISVAGAVKAGQTESRFVLTLLLLQLVSYIFMFIITPNEPIAQMRDSLPRLLLHVAPLGVSLLAYQMSGSGPAILPTRSIQQTIQEGRART